MSAVETSEAGDANRRGAANRRRRVLVVGRYFWPLLSHDSAGQTCRLVAGLAREGLHVEVLTPKQHTNWPDHIWWNGVAVHRPATYPRHDWSIGRYTRHLTNWIESHCQHFDVIIAMSMRDEAAAVVEAATRLGIASIVHDSGEDERSDLSWSGRLRTAKKTWTNAGQAERIVTTSAAKHRDLLAAGCSPARVIRIEGGMASAVTFTGNMKPIADVGDRREAARRSLADINLDLDTSPDSPVVLGVGRMNLDSGLHRVAGHAMWLLSRFPNARLWLIGDGPARSTIHRDLKADGVRDAVAMPGSFANLEDLYAAADVFVQIDSHGLGCLVPTAISHALPVVIASTGATRAALGDDECVHWFDVDETGKSFRDVLRSVLEDLPAARQRALQTTRHYLKIRPYQHVLDQYVQLVETLSGHAVTRKQGRAT